MILVRLLILISVVTLCHFISRISGHAYFAYPIPRNAYCTNASCTSNSTLNSQGPVWSLPANSLLSTFSPISQITCNGSMLAMNALQGNSYDPGFRNITAATWTAGSTQTLLIFISQTHSPENQSISPPDGWQILYRDGTQSNSIFSPIPFTYGNASYTTSSGPAAAIGFQLGTNISVTITVPSTSTNDGIFQFFWRNNEVPNGNGSGVMWLSCIDVTITAFAANLIPSIFSILFAFLFASAVSAAFNIPY